MSRNMDDYVEVSERIEKFYKKYPEGSLRCKDVRPLEVGAAHFLLYIAQAFRTPDDPAPSEGVAWEPVPGKTNFTRDSEAMNAETSAWGRAIAGLGFEVKRGIASANEVRNRQDADAEAPQAKSDQATGPQKAAITRRCKELSISDEHKPLLIDWAGGMPLTQGKAGKLITLLKTAQDFAGVWDGAGLPNPKASRPPAEGEQTLEDAVLAPGGAAALGLTEHDE